MFKLKRALWCKSRFFLLYEACHHTSFYCYNVDTYRKGLIGKDVEYKGYTQPLIQQGADRTLKRAVNTSLAVIIYLKNPDGCVIFISIFCFKCIPNKSLHKINILTIAADVNFLM